MKAIEAPPNIEKRKPTQGDPVSMVAIKPAMAPNIIIPSTPRFKTPVFSTINSPKAANKIGVAATIRLAKSNGIWMSPRSISYSTLL